MSSDSKTPTLISDPVAKALAQRMSALDMSYESREHLRKMRKNKSNSSEDISINDPIKDPLLSGFSRMTKTEESKMNGFDRLMMKSMRCVDLKYVKEKEDIYNKLIEDFPTSLGKQVSKKDKEKLPHYKSALTYGEISFESFAVALEKIRMKYGLPNANLSGPEGVMQKPGGIFYDIGSGTGKPVFAAAIMFSFEKVIGIELLDGLYQVSLNIDKTWKKMKIDNPNINKHGYESEVKFEKGDILDLNVKDWSDGDVLFANSTCFDDKLMEALGKKSNCLRKGAFFITLTRRLPNSNFKVLESEMYNMSWGGATVFIQQKLTDSWCNVDDLQEENKARKK